MDITEGKVFLFDSDQHCVFFFQRIFKDYFPGKVFLTDNPGNQSFSICISEKPDIIIMEAFNTGMHGVKLIKKIKQSEQLKDIPLIALTEEGGNGSICQKVIDAGADAFLQKPLNEAGCVSLLKLCVRLYALEQAVDQDKKTLLLQLADKASEVEHLKTYRSRTEEALRVERDFATQVLNAMGQGLTITNSSGYFQFANPGFCRMVGYDLQDVLGKTPYDFTIKEDHHILKAARKIRHTGQVNSYETKIKHRNGETIDVYITGVPYYQAGGIVGSIAVLTDVTQLKDTGNRLKKLSGEYEQIFNSTQDALLLIEVITGNKFRYVRNNRSHQERTGLSQETIAGKTPEELFGQKAGATLSANYARCVAARKTIIYLEEFSPEVSDERWWQTSLTPIFEHGKVTNIVGASIDITSLKDLKR